MIFTKKFYVLEFRLKKIIEYKNNTVEVKIREEQPIITIAQELTWHFVKKANVIGKGEVAQTSSDVAIRS